MRRAAALCAAAAASAEPQAWRDQVTDKAALAQPALSDELIGAVNRDPASTWVAGRNARFEGMTLGDTRVQMGLLQETDSSKWLPHRPLKSVAIPDEFDWRTDARGAKCPSLKEIRDQANCGSCWAFGSVEAMTDRICLYSNGTKNVHLSAQDMMACNHLGDMGCSGGIPFTAYTYYKTSGVVSGGNYGDTSGCWSYQIEPCAHHSASSKYPSCDSTPKGKAGSCAKKCENPALTWADDKHKGQAGYSVCKQGPGATPCAEAMAQEIYQNGPITAGFTVRQSFESYKSGVYQHSKGSDPQLGGHAIKILGYGNENGVPYWLVANSWNEDWADLGGFFKIIRGKNEGQLEDPAMNGGPTGGEPLL